MTENLDRFSFLRETKRSESVHNFINKINKRQVFYVHVIGSSDSPFNNSVTPKLFLSDIRLKEKAY